MMTMFKGEPDWSTKQLLDAIKTEAVRGGNEGNLTFMMPAFSALIDLQREILTAQAQQSALIENVSKLEKEVTALKAWDADKQRYELKDLWRGFFAFIPKEGMENGEPPHAICANCYQRGFKSFLQSSGHPVIHDRSWDCHACKAKIKNQSNNMGELIAKCRGAIA